MLSLTRLPVEADARARAAHTYADGKPITDAGLLIRCADQIEQLKATLKEIAANAPNRGGVWARKVAEETLKHAG